ncbi:MAG: hypothetical protein PHN72_02365 [Bacilli bacterium]|nr:hypothetical protein [Bacilli bacterium]
MNLSEQYIGEALKFYKIDDIEYKNQCINCINEIKTNPQLYNRFMEVVHILYEQAHDEISKLWRYPNINDVFGEESCDFITNVCLLMGFKQHQFLMEFKNFDKNQFTIHKKRVKECLTNDIYKKNCNSIRLSQMLWGAYFVNIKLIEVGRLQYEDCGEHIKIHIPRGENLDYIEVINSLKNAREYIQKYFGYKGTAYYCDSWLLSQQVKRILDSSNNIMKFQSLFEIKEGKNCKEDILKFVFDVLDYKEDNSLSEETTLQRKLKKYLREGTLIKSGIGKLKEEILEPEN